MSSLRTNTLAPDLRAAAGFLATLDPNASEFTFAVFDDVTRPDGRKRGRRDLCRNCLHGPLDRLAPQLTATSEKHDPRTQERAWRSFNGEGVGLGTIFHLSKELSVCR